MANTVLIQNTLPPPPKFGQQGPESQRDWDVFYRWLQSIYSILLLAQSASSQTIAFNQPSIPNVALQGELDGLFWMAQSAFARPSIPANFGSRAFVANALPAPWTIPAGTHGQGIAPIVQCWSGPLVGDGPTGYLVTPEILIAAGDITVDYAMASVGSIVIRM
jgi:hypothetical protein